jgi:hypothetical protein
VFENSRLAGADAAPRLGVHRPVGAAGEQNPGIAGDHALHGIQLHAQHRIMDLFCFVKTK